MKGIIIFLSVFSLCNSEAKALDFINAPNAYWPTKQLWTKVYKSLIKTNASVRGTTYIRSLQGNGQKDKKHKNGARDTIVFIPHATNFKQPIDVIFYFHGLGGFKERDFKTRVLEHTPLVDSTKNYIIVIPEMPWSKNTSTPRTRQGRVFNKKGLFGVFVESVRRILREHFHPKCEDRCPLTPAHILGDITLLGHSAGGSTLMSISKHGGLHWLYNTAGASSVRVIFSDASYGYWLDIAWKSFRPHIQGTHFLILTRKWDTPHKHTIRFLKKFKNTPANIEHIVFPRSVTHAGIGDISFSWVYGGSIESGCGEGESR